MSNRVQNFGLTLAYDEISHHTGDRRARRELAQVLLWVAFMKNANVPDSARFNPTFVLVEDDLMLRRAWITSARVQKRSLVAFSTPDELLESFATIPEEAVFLLDNWIFGVERGLELAKTIRHRRQSATILLQTSDDTSRFSAGIEAGDVDGVLGKDVDFVLPEWFAQQWGGRGASAESCSIASF